MRDSDEMTRGDPAPRTAEWVTVHVASMSQVLVLRALLENSDIPTFVPDESMKTIDPFVTGFSPLEVRLQTPASQVALAREILGNSGLPVGLGADAAPVHGEPDLDAIPVDATNQEPLEDEPLEVHGRRIRWASLLTITSPIALLLAPSYVSAARGRTPPPPDHALTLAAIALAGVTVLVGVIRWLIWLT